MPVSSATCRLAITPPVGPETTHVDGRRGGGLERHLAAVRLDDDGVRASARPRRSAGASSPQLAG